MGNQSIIYGYIETSSIDNEYNQCALCKFKYDEVYPFTDIFSYTQLNGFRASIISLAGSYKGLDEDWDEWQNKFEKLLSKLKANFVRISLDDEIDGFLFGYVYVKEHGTQNWTRWKTDQAGDTSDEVMIDLSVTT